MFLLLKLVASRILMSLVSNSVATQKHASAAEQRDENQARRIKRIQRHVGVPSSSADSDDIGSIAGDQVDEKVRDWLGGIKTIVEENEEGSECPEMPANEVLMRKYLGAPTQPPHPKPPDQDTRGVKNAPQKKDQPVSKSKADPKPTDKTRILYRRVLHPHVVNILYVEQPAVIETLLTTPSSQGQFSPFFKVD
ncbi:hypothetical protein B0H66DRAFT_630466 [Apodospora peruviana]|uniref:Uncharacterized protein n=1 Tax=Apodospora peruviana TaxID=516989 RepID=A0AAE0LZX6_9PEZI|nr:hypothetical protein B0H66DRAFT_630466 [Apodospora peruviana]